MKKLMSGLLGLAVICLTAQVSLAGWVKQGRYDLTLSTNGQQVNYAVFENTSPAPSNPGSYSAGDAWDPTSGAYLYLYQINPGVRNDPVDYRRALLDSPDYEKAGIVVDAVLVDVDAGDTPSLSSGTTANGDSVTGDLLYAFSPGSSSSPTALLWLTSNRAPVFGDLTVGNASFNTTEVAKVQTPSGPVVPVPPALALVGLGLPFARLLKRRK